MPLQRRLCFQLPTMKAASNIYAMFHSKMVAQNKPERCVKNKTQDGWMFIP